MDAPCTGTGLPTRSQGEKCGRQMGFSGIRKSTAMNDVAAALRTHEAGMHAHVGPMTHRGEFPPAIPRAGCSPAEPASASPADLTIPRHTRPRKHPRTLIHHHPASHVHKSAHPGRKNGAPAETEKLNWLGVRAKRRGSYPARAKCGSNNVCRCSSTQARASSLSATPRRARPCEWPRWRSAAYLARHFGSRWLATRAQ